MLKAAIKQMVKQFGYRIVPRELDSRTAYEKIRAIPFRTIIDVGANTGLTVKKWLYDFPDATIHAIEPIPECFAKLSALEVESDGRLIAWNFAASDKFGSVPFYVHTEHPSSSSLLRATNYSGKVLPFTQSESLRTVEAKPLDSLFAEHQFALTNPVLVKIDVQGAEDQVLNGGRRILSKTNMIITEVSVAPLYEGQSNFTTVLDILTKEKFSFFGILEQFHLSDGTPVYFDAVFLNNDMGLS